MSFQIDVAITTWPKTLYRVSYFRRTLASLRKYIKTDYDVRWLCHSETERSDKFRSLLTKVCEDEEVELFWKEGPADLGTNVNAMFEEVTGDYVFIAQDDRELIMDLDLTTGLDFLEDHPRVAAVWYEWFKQGISYCAKIGDFRINSSESIWLITDRQMLVRRNFLKEHGKYSEHLPHGVLETELDERFKANNIPVAIPKDVHFAHIPEMIHAPN